MDFLLFCAAVTTALLPLCLAMDALINAVAGKRCKTADCAPAQSDRENILKNVVAVAVGGFARLFRSAGFGRYNGLSRRDNFALGVFWLSLSAAGFWFLFALMSSWLGDLYRIALAACSSGL